jgi:Protein of unknown function (DUF2897)
VFKAIIIIVLAVGVIVGGLLTLRNSGRSGMPSDDVLRRASKRARVEDAAERDEEGQPPK